MSPQFKLTHYPLESRSSSGGSTSSVRCLLNCSMVPKCFWHVEQPVSTILCCGFMNVSRLWRSISSRRAFNSSDFFTISPWRALCCSVVLGWASQAKTGWYHQWWNDIAVAETRYILLVSAEGISVGYKPISPQVDIPVVDHLNLFRTQIVNWLQKH